MHHRTGRATFGPVWFGQVVRRRGHRTWLDAGNEHRDERLFEVIARFLAGDELGAPGLNLSPVERFALQSAQPDIHERRDRSAREAGHQGPGITVTLRAI